jgi:ATP-binding protein involved in chromosome partitioning
MKTVLVASGKGGTGKTTTTAMLGGVLALEYRVKVALLDLDITGPNLAHMVGVEPYGVHVDEDFFYPKQRGALLEVFSPSFLIPPDTACSWSGDRRMELIRELLLKVKWNDPDVMLYDCPPGTGDEIMAVLKYAQGVSGAIIVTSGKNESLVDARRIISLLRSERFNVPIIGLIENMRYMETTGGTMPLFDDGIDFQEELGVPVIGRIPYRAGTLTNDEAITDYKPPVDILAGFLGIAGNGKDGCSE